MGCNYSALNACKGVISGVIGPGAPPPGTGEPPGEDPLKDIPDTPDGVRADFKLSEICGKGSFGTVFRATHRRTGEVVAVKVMDRAKIKASSIYREFNVLEHIGHHPWVVGYKGTYKTKESVSFVLEFMGGGELFDRLLKNGAYPETEIRLPCKRLGEALAYIHSRNIVHRDVKPENILLASAAENCSIMKLADFGLSQLIGHNGRWSLYPWARECSYSPTRQSPSLLRSPC